MSWNTLSRNTLDCLDVISPATARGYRSVLRWLGRPVHIAA
ncbi:hypothetical protein BZL29_2982 [Mycobacterium kansasii]|uniref:Uncharacterized protein n=1 Tax=Mycobacterium kansasii TaxID=1768 RepID=A0A1V3XGE2_MYCKA|nr:hypothetical protein BZL29_2982 [Mycobacterium kansasii]